MVSSIKGDSPVFTIEPVLILLTGNQMREPTSAKLRWATGPA